MSKNKPDYECTACGLRLNKWSGQCPECREWNSIAETAAESRPGGRFGGYAGQLGNKVKKL